MFEKRCAGCHALDSEKTGPRLRGVFGRPAGSVPKFPYSEPLRKSGVTWDASSLDKWLTDPDGFIPDNNMAFRVVNKDERAIIIEYLKDVSPKIRRSPGLQSSGGPGDLDACRSATRPTEPRRRVAAPRLESVLGRAAAWDEPEHHGSAATSASRFCKSVRLRQKKPILKGEGRMPPARGKGYSGAGKGRRVLSPFST
jgi:cytochrome c